MDKPVDTQADKEARKKNFQKFAVLTIGLLSVGVALQVFVLQPSLVEKERGPIESASADGSTWSQLGFKGAFRKITGKTVAPSGEVAPAESAQAEGAAPAQEGGEAGSPDQPASETD